MKRKIIWTSVIAAALGAVAVVVTPLSPELAQVLALTSITSAILSTRE